MNEEEKKAFEELSKKAVLCNYENIGCTKCWTNAVKQVKRRTNL